jgi:hypothetical protein
MPFLPSQDQRGPKNRDHRLINPLHQNLMTEGWHDLSQRRKIIN